MVTHPAYNAGPCLCGKDGDLSRVNFFSSMLPLAPPPKPLQKRQSIASTFIWKGKQPRIKMSTFHKEHRVVFQCQILNYTFGPSFSVQSQFG